MAKKGKLFQSIGLLALVLASLACSLVTGATATLPPGQATSQATQPPPATTEPTLPPTAVPPTPVAVITPDSKVRRLTASVFAGQANPLPELATDEVLNLDAGGLVTTDKNGEAEITIHGCLKLFVFQDTSLTRNTCRKADAASGLGVCGTAGMTGVVNNCTTQVDIQTPSSNVVTHGTWFSVIYLAPDQLSIVQVYEGSVDVHALIDPATGQSTGGQQVDAGNLWFTSPGADAPTIGGVQGRQVQPMEVWDGIRPALIDKYPDLDRWMRSARNRARSANLNFPSTLVPISGQVNLHILGTAWNDQDAQNAVLQGTPWGQIVNDLWPGTPITFQVQFPDRTIDDATTQTYDLANAQSLVRQSVFYTAPAGSTVRIAVVENNDAGLNFANEFQKYLSNVGFEASVVTWSAEELKKNLTAYKSGKGSPLIWIDESGDFFK